MLHCWQRSIVLKARRCPPCRCITKLFPTRSHTVAAQGGINAALGNMTGAHGWGLGALPVWPQRAQLPAAACCKAERFLCSLVPPLPRPSPAVAPAVLSAPLS